MRWVSAERRASASMRCSAWATQSRTVTRPMRALAAEGLRYAARLGKQGSRKARLVLFQVFAPHDQGESGDELVLKIEHRGCERREVRDEVPMSARVTELSHLRRSLGNASCSSGGGAGRPGPITT